MHERVFLGSQKDRSHWKDLDVVGRIILKIDLREIEWRDMDWIYLAQDRGQ
jgi:hypothetical protein